MNHFSAWLAQQAQQRQSAGTHRSIKPRSLAEGTLDLASNDYLGLSQNPQVTASAAAASTPTGGSAAAKAPAVPGGRVPQVGTERVTEEFQKKVQLPNIGFVFGKDYGFRVLLLANCPK